MSSPFIRTLRWLILITAALSIPILPVIVLGLSFEDRLENWLAVPMTATRRFWFIVGLLSTDLLLPIPSSAVSTYGGGRLGFGLATLASWLGMTIGGLIGYAAGRWLGEPFVRRMVDPHDILALRQFLDRYGALAVIATRPLPILAEAGILLIGVVRLPLRQLLPALLIGNLIVSAVYSAFGAIVQAEGALPIAIIISAIVPVLIALAVRWRLRRANTNPKR